MTTTPKEGAPAPSIETAAQRRERLEKVIIGMTGKVLMAEDLVDAIVASDRAAGCDPEALLALIDLEQREKRDLQYERDAARAEIERLTVENAAIRPADGHGAAMLFDLYKSRGVDLATAQAEVKRLKADLTKQNDLAARLAALVAAAKKATCPDIRSCGRDEMHGLTIGDERAYLVEADAIDHLGRALTNLPARAAALLECVGAADTLIAAIQNAVDGGLTLPDDACDAINATVNALVALDGESR